MSIHDSNGYMRRNYYVFQFSNYKKYCEIILDIAKYAKLTIAAGAFSTKGGSVTASSATLSDTNTSGISVTGKATATVTKSGWINAGDAAASSQTRYLTEAVIGAGKKLKVTLSTGTTSAPTELIIVDGINTWHFKRDKDNNTWIE